MTILGIDVSKWNGNWDAKKAKQAGASFVFIKASQATFSDPQFAANWQKAREAGLLRGAYHYLDYTKSGLEQANYFADLLKADPGELPPVVDYEQTRTDNNPTAALGFLKEFLDRMIQRTELYADARIKVPMIYSGPGMWAAYGDQTRPEYWLQFPLWNAHWITSSAPIVPPPWTMWTFWQYTSKGPGEMFGSESLAVDMDRFNGTLSELQEFAGVRIPLENLNELVEALDEKVDGLSNEVAELQTSSGTPDPNLVAQVNSLGDQVSNLGGTLATVNTLLTQRLTVVEEKLAGMTIPTPIPTPTPTPTPTPGTDVYAVCNTAALNVRSGPATTYQVVAGLKLGSRVKVLNRLNGWAQIDSPAGWCSEIYLTFDQAPTPTPTPTPTPAPTYTYAICNTSALNVRSGPGISFPIVAGITYGQRVKILSRKDGWAQIDSPAGWCNESYLSF